MTKLTSKLVITLMDGERQITTLGSEKSLREWMKSRGYIYKVRTDNALMSEMCSVIIFNGLSKSSPELRIQRDTYVLVPVDEPEMIWKLI